MLKVAENFYLLSDDPASWINEISHIFTEKFPELTEFGIEIKISKINPEIGFALGSITLFSDTDEVHIPIIIRNKKLAPFDVFEYRKIYYPLKSSKIINILYAGKLGVPASPVPVERAARPTMIGELTPPPFGVGPRGEYYTEVRELPKAASLFTAISRNVFSENVKNVYDKFIKIAQSLSLVELVQKILDRIMSIQGGLLSAKSYLKNEIRRVRRHAFLIKKTGADAYEIVFNPIGEVCPKSIVVNSEGLIKLLNALKYDIPTVFADLDSGKVIYFSPVLQPLVPIVLEKVNGQPVNSSGRYVFVTANGRIIRGMVIKNFSGGWMLFSDPYAIADSLYGVKESDYIDKTPYNRECSPGQTILLRVIASDRSNAVGIGPVKVFKVFSKRATCQVKPVDSSTISSLDKYIGHVINICGKYGDFPVKIVINTTNEGEAPLSVRKTELGEIIIEINTWNFDILPVTYEVTLPTNEQEFYDYLMLATRPVNVEYLGDETYLIVSGPDKYQVSGKDKFVLVLTSTNISKENAMKIASILEKHKKLTLIGPQIINKKVSLEKTGMSSQKLKEFLGIDDNLIKSAIISGEGLAIDTVFSLNLINPQNISKFIESIPLIRATVNELAKLLIFVRLGFKEIPEEELAYLIKKLDEIADKLESLRLIYKIEKV